MKENIALKIKDSLKSIIPISLIIAILSFTITPLDADVIVKFLIGAVMLIVGMGFFTLGAEMSMTIIGERIRCWYNKEKKYFSCNAYYNNIRNSYNNCRTRFKGFSRTSLILVVVGLGVGIFLSIAFFRVRVKIKLKYILCFLYFITFLVAAFIPKEFLAIAFDTGGATTGPMAVPFVIALGIGMASIRNDKNSESDSFGMVAICSIGPILAMMILRFSL